MRFIDLNDRRTYTLSEIRKEWELLRNQEPENHAQGVTSFQMMGSTYPKSFIERLIFSYAGSPGFRSFLGLYFAGFSLETGTFCMFISA